MIRDEAMKLVAALRSGRYIQGAEYLARDGKHCCLGVACVIADIPNRVEITDAEFEEPEDVGGELELVEKEHRTTYFDGKHDMDLSPAAMSHYGFHDPAGGRRDGARLGFPGFEKTFRSLADANDAGVPFTLIADYIELNWEAL